MEIGVIDRTPFLERVLDELSQVPLTEAGRAVVPRYTPGMPGARGQVLLCCDFDGQVAEPLRSALLRDTQCGVLVISARSCCHAHGALRSLITTQVLDPRRVALFGMHERTVEERAFLDAHRVQIYSMLEISRENLRESTDAVMTFVRTWRSFIVIVDLDVLDPAFAPGIATAVPGGMTARELLYVVQRLSLIPSLAGAIVVADGVVPSGNVLHADAAARLCARLVAEFVARG